jgi:hypothetical protein
MTRIRTASSVGAAAATAVLALSLVAGTALAGEITGNGRLLTVHGRSDCAYSGQEDLQFFEDDEDTIAKAQPTKGDPGHAQSWGQIPKEVRDYLTSIGLNPGISCNPNLSTFGE